MANQRIPQNWQSPYTASSLIDHFAGSTLTVATCAYLQSTIGGIVIGVTSHSADLTGLPGYPGVVFKMVSGITPSRLENPEGLQPTNLEQDLFMLTGLISESDVLAGKWDNAPCVVFNVNFEALNMGQLILFSGHLARRETMGPMIRLELRGKNDALSQMVGKVTEPLCTADVYDDKCKLDAVARGEIHTVTITQVTDQTRFRASSLTQGSEYFDNAKGIFNDGPNAGFEFHNDTWNPTLKEFALRSPMPFLPVVGNSITVKRGCKKRESDCAARNNVINIRSHPHVPTLEQIQRLPAQ